MRNVICKIGGTEETKNTDRTCDDCKFYNFEKKDITTGENRVITTRPLAHVINVLYIEFNYNKLIILFIYITYFYYL